MIDSLSISTALGALLSNGEISKRYASIQSNIADKKKDWRNMASNTLTMKAVCRAGNAWKVKDMEPIFWKFVLK